ncbi:MAG: GAF domain-containing protein [Nitrospinae bacterium]|nr:GAF domain-containing protein [Nitrospinota bacterium]
MIISNPLTHLIELTGNVTDAFTAALYRADHDKETLILRHHISLSQEFDTKAEIRFGDGPIGNVARSKQPFLDEHFDQNPVDLHIYKKKEDLKSFLAIPVIYKDLEGVLVIDTKGSYHFPAKLQKIVAGFAEQMAWHLNREKKGALGEEPCESLFRDLVSYCRFIAESPDRVTVAERLSHVPSSILETNAYAIVWFDSDGFGKVEKYRGFHQNAVRVPVRHSQGLAGSCAKSQCPILLRNTTGRATVIFGVGEERGPFQSLMAAPIVLNSHLYGVAVCGAKTPGSFSDAELNRLTLMASSAASALFCAETRERWNYDKNLDQITGIPNHRFLAEHHKALEEDVLKEGKPTCFLTLQMNNLPEIYKTSGIDHGDRLQRQVASMLSKNLPSPKYIFKFSDTVYIMILMNRKRSEVLPLRDRLAQVFKNTPLFVDGTPIRLSAELGMACFPEDGKTLSELIGASWCKTSSKTSRETKVTL